MPRCCARPARRPERRQHLDPDAVGLDLHQLSSSHSTQLLLARRLSGRRDYAEVVTYVAKGEDDFVATCKDGNRYRVYVKDGRVVVEKQ